MKKILSFTAMISLVSALGCSNNPTSGPKFFDRAIISDGKISFYAKSIYGTMWVRTYDVRLVSVQVKEDGIGTSFTTTYDADKPTSVIVYVRKEEQKYTWNIALESEYKTMSYPGDVLPEVQ